MALSVVNPWGIKSDDLVCAIMKQDYWSNRRIMPLSWLFPTDKGDERAIFQAMANKAHLAVESLDQTFKAKNHGKFVVMSYSGDMLALGDTIQDIRGQLREKGIHGNAHIERIGYKSLAKIVR